MSFYNQQGRKIIKIYKDGALVYDDPDFIDFTGDVDVYNESDGVVVNVPGGGSLNVVFGEIVAGVGNTFTLAHEPIGTISLGANGQLLIEGEDYTISGAVITTISSWESGKVVANYQY